jgi:hypothetical protein
MACVSLSSLSIAPNTGPARTNKDPKA